MIMAICSLTNSGCMPHLVRMHDNFLYPTVMILLSMTERLAGIRDVSSET